MRQRLADYVADFLVAKGITDCFMVVGGGAMHLNDAFGHKEGLHCTYNHHEQASAIAAEAYARVNNKIAAVCVTTGPGGTNAITGVVGGWLDSVPMLIISGQVRYDTTARYAERYTEGHPLRAAGDQEFDITKAVGCMCKYAVMLEEANQIRYVLEKAYYLALSGRCGPCWIDIPVDYQGCYIETDTLPGYSPSEDPDEMPEKVSDDVLECILEKVRTSRRPVLYAGNGIRLSGGYQAFREAVENLGVPVVTCWDSIDAIEDASPLYVGRGGIMGDRPGNFAVQNADFVLAVGNRLSIRQVGYNWKSWAREAYVAMVDIDPAELRKHTIHVELPVCADAKDFFEGLNRKLTKVNSPLFKGREWLNACQGWKRDYPVTLPQHWEEDGAYANVYAFIKYLSSSLPEGNMTVVSNGSACVVGSHNYVIKKDARFLINSAIASMGYGLPAAIGACIACSNETTVCLEGDGSLMMNLQELQTVLQNKLPIKLFLINNQGYHSIRQTQNNLFSEHSNVGIGPESGDLSFPDYEKIARAFGWPYYSAHSNAEMKEAVDVVLETKGMAFCEVFVSPDQNFEPKSATKRLADGTLVSPPLEDLAPFLGREEVLKNLFITPVDE
ncbi:thiamine pyrophosphate-binding protein [Murimonas intestini]|uniref:Acetolactate synthase-1/2/3 large subunit n=1 Tax=Murimonas intestini TaxID=1337051 RepID=A0AB73SYY9_9FIRM|nr:thiamine pyrophosphate-binding protein [Murimonas intestini]MCR1842972.1 thiamine pyrophosphate-binding protein [Murimonas intestini]MCR1864779.1 thiamine pyrophosphate-binding protein [Murimonas intestini]MCR1885441.1 thiamine pyrophosphate-binding protein [Murimonas intestini]